MDFSDVKNLTKEDLLAVVGLASKRTMTERVLEATTYFGAGLIIGVGAALLLAPKSGKGLREDLGAGLRRVTGGRPAEPGAEPAPAEGSPQARA